MFFFCAVLALHSFMLRDEENRTKGDPAPRSPRARSVGYGMARACAQSLHHLIEALREIGDGLGIDLALVPLQQHIEIGAARPPGLPALPAVAAQIIGG